ncbi:hypothetical protein ACFLUU_09800 [Chloroflexota bacterium]
MSKARKLCILAAIAIPIALTVVALSLTGGYVRNAIVFGSVSAVWSICCLYIAWKVSRPREADQLQHVTTKIPRHRYITIFDRTFWLLVLVSGITLLVIGLVRNAAMYRVLAALWFIIIGGGHLLFVNIMIDK